MTLTSAHGLTDTEFYDLLAKYEPKLAWMDAIEAWRTFCAWDGSRKHETRR